MDSLFNEIYNNIITEENIIEDTCNICHFKTTENKIKLNCGHNFHKKCISNTFLKIFNCPYCNKIFSFFVVNKEAISCGFKGMIKRY